MTESIQISLQNMAASDRSWSLVNSVSAAFARRLQQRMDQSEKTQIGDRLLQNDAYSRAVGGGAIWGRCGLRWAP
ncbi:hypothetical protein M8494_17925 [Serratia ureilytica]